MKILAVDTTSKICSVALLEDNNLIDENTIDNGLTHSENLMPLIEDLFNKNSINLKDIGLIAICTGPGSFTGIRIGIASVKAMAEVYNIPIASVTSLESLAESTTKTDTIVSLIDAKNNQVYAGIFDKNINLLEEYVADDINVVLEKIYKYKNITFVGNGAVLHKEFIKSKIEKAYFSEKNEQNSYYVGKIGLKKYFNKELDTADTLMPVYLRNKSYKRI